MGFDRFAAKHAARESMRLNNPNPVLVTLAYLALTTLLSVAISYLLYDPTTEIIQYATWGYEAEEILEFAWGLGKNFIEQRFPVCLLCWSQPEFAWEEYRCGTIQELAEAYCGIFGTALSERVNPKAEEHMRNCYPFLKSYLAVGAQDGSVRVQMTEND